MKFNMGCGFRKASGYVNVDKFSECSPDIQMDLETLPWPIESDQAEEVAFIHCLEHLGQRPDVFLGIMKELYRICRHNAKVIIHVPHPRHDFFIGDPTHVRPITPIVLSLFSKELNIEWKKANIANSPLALYLNVDFETTEIIQVPDSYYQRKLDNRELTFEQMERFAQERNNVVQEYRFTLKVIK